MQEEKDVGRSVSIASELAQARLCFAAGTLKELERAMESLERVKAGLGGVELDEAGRWEVKRGLDGLRALVQHGLNYWAELAARRGHGGVDPAVRSWEA